METFWPIFLHWRPHWLLYLLPHGFPDFSAASQYGQVEEPGPKLDLNLSLYSMAHSESEYDQAEAVTSLSLPPE